MKYHQEVLLAKLLIPAFELLCVIAQLQIALIPTPLSLLERRLTLESLEANYLDMVNYSVFALVLPCWTVLPLMSKWKSMF